MDTHHTHAGMPALFLDFDGVLFDSVPEAYLLARFACTGKSVQDAVDEAEYARFRGIRHLIVNSWQYRALYALASAPVPDTEAAFRAMTSAGKQTEDTAFDAAFLAERKRLIAEENEFWQGLSAPLPFLEMVRPLFASAIPPVIVTTKGRDAVLAGMARQGIQLQPALVLDKQDFAAFGDKGRLLQHYMEAHGIRRAFFVDDCAENISACSSVSWLTCLQAGWGYSAPGDTVLTEQEVMHRITAPVS